MKEEINFNDHTLIDKMEVDYRLTIPEDVKFMLKTWHFKSIQTLKDQKEVYLDY